MTWSLGSFGWRRGGICRKQTSPIKRSYFYGTEEVFLLWGVLFNPGNIVTPPKKSHFFTYLCHMSVIWSITLADRTLQGPTCYRSCGMTSRTHWKWGGWKKYWAWASPWSLMVPDFSGALIFLKKVHNKDQEIIKRISIFQCNLFSKATFLENELVILIFWVNYP